MRDWKKAVMVLLAAVALAAVSHRALSRRPVELLLLKAEGKEAEAFRVRLFLNGRESGVDVLPLDEAQRKRAIRAVSGRDRRTLEELAKELGDPRFVAGIRGLREGWPWYLGGPGDLDDDAGNLGWLDKCYLLVVSGGVPPPRFVQRKAPETGMDPVELAVELELEPREPTATPGPLSGAVVKMEILNDCGIKGAADGIARAVKRPGIEIIRVGNTKRFRYRRTHFQSSVGVPVVLQEILDEMGIDEKEVQEFLPGRREADVVLVVGRDYRKILERMSDRTRD